MNAPQTSSVADALRQVAMIAQIDTTALGLSRTDKTASKKTEADHAARDGTAKVVVNRFAGADDEIRAVLEVQRLAQENLKRYTMSWGSTKRRLLPNSNFMAWNSEHARLEKLHYEQLQLLLDNADAILAKAARNLGSFDVPMPTKNDIATAFTISHQLEPIPDGRHFATFMGSDDAVQQMDAHLAHQFEENMKAAYNFAQQDACTRLAKPLESLAERMEAYSKREQQKANGADPGKEGYFRDSIITNVQEIAVVFGEMNVLGDPTLDAIAKKVKVFEKINPDVLRKRDDVRNAIAQRARDIVKDLDGFLAR